MKIVYKSGQSDIDNEQRAEPKALTCTNAMKKHASTHTDESCVTSTYDRISAELFFLNALGPDISGAERNNGGVLSPSQN